MRASYTSSTERAGRAFEKYGMPAEQPKGGEDCKLGTSPRNSRVKVLRGGSL